MTQTNKKYELLDHDTVQTWDGRTLKRIRALVAIDTLVAAGDLGGYIESEGNLDCDGDAWVYGNAQVSGDAQVYGNAQVSGDAWVYGNAQIEQRTDLFWISIIGSENGTYTAFKNKDGGILVNRGCFSGTLEEFTDAVNKRHEGKFNQEYQLVIELTKLRLGQQV
ncbi:hypothetical protein [Acinetobacter sp. CFCC 11171]|uniref:hypothetical protein n=1 Tax=Acinetobacter sp. CFCC 11171 TaxID=1775558 RepID=UPI000DD07077|nr:hypothetical protein [Acinetobacter sp. CFCC 11171]